MISPTKRTTKDLKSFRVQARKPPPSGTFPPEDRVAVTQYHPDFEKIIGNTFEFTLLVSSEDSSGRPLFRNGCVHVSEKDELYIMSDLLQSTNSSTLPTVLISKITLYCDTSEGSFTVDWLKLRPPQNMSMPAGACLFNGGILYCSQGTLASDTGGLWHMPWGKPPIPILTSYFGKPFNSIQNVVPDNKGHLWFTDASIGFELDIRPKPKLPNQVYRFDMDSKSVRVVADGFGRPTGIAISPDGNTLYVTDTDAYRPDGSTDPTRAATIYAFDIIERSNSCFLSNRRVFAYAVCGVPMAVTCDDAGNVYAACGDGVEIWSPGGTNLGLLQLPGGCTTLCFGATGALYIGTGQRLWMMGVIH